MAIQAENPLQPGLLKFSIPKTGVSTHLFAGTPSHNLLSKKLTLSITTNIHSASARPEYLACTAAGPLGSNGPSSSRLFMLSEPAERVTSV